MTSSPEGGGGLVLLDACCLINLFATGRAEEVLESLPYRFAVARYVLEEEVLEISAEGGKERSPAEEGRASLRPFLAKLVERGILERLDVDTEEEEAQLVRFAAELDDGESHTCALALVRGACVASDDKKAIRVVRSAWRSRGYEMEPVLRTSDILFSWAQMRGIDQADLVRIVRAVARHASFFPPKDDPHFEPWMELLQRED